IEVTIGNLAPQIFTFDTSGKSKSSMGWVTDSFLFTADGTSTLSFRSLTLGPGGTLDSADYGPALDNVSVTAVPEASTWVMMVAGFLGLGFLTYRRKSHGEVLNAA